MPAVHLAAGDLQLGLGHGAHLEILGAPGPRAHDGRQGHRAQLRLANTVELLLQHCRPEMGGKKAAGRSRNTWTNLPKPASPPCTSTPRVKGARGVPGAAAIPQHGTLTSWETPSPPAWWTPHHPPDRSDPCSFSVEVKRKHVSLCAPPHRCPGWGTPKTPRHVPSPPSSTACPRGTLQHPEERSWL